MDYKNHNYELSFDGIDKSKYLNTSIDEATSLGIELFNSAISNQFQSNEIQTVPLSGGLDSRAILGSLLEHTNASNIQTYTFGTPGTYDYEIGTKLAKYFGTKHINFDLSKHVFTMQELLVMANRNDYQTVLFHHPPMTPVDDFVGDSVVWSGAIIDVFFGRHKHTKKSDNEFEAKNNFIRENLFQKTISLTTDDDLSLHKYIDFNTNISEKIGYEHYIDLVNRQLKFIAPHVLSRGYKYKVLFNDEDLVKFALSLPDKYIEDQFLYKKMFLKAFPSMFKFPTKSSYGLRLDCNNSIVNAKKNMLRLQNKINRYTTIFNNPMLNYIDFNYGLKNRDDLRKIVYENIMDLDRRQLLASIKAEEIWKDFNEGRDFSKALILLASLEINLKSEEQFKQVERK